MKKKKEKGGAVGRGIGGETALGERELRAGGEEGYEKRKKDSGDTAGRKGEKSNKKGNSNPQKKKRRKAK